MNFLIIGGDAAGMSAASRAKRNAPDMNVTVLEKSMDVSYSACGMPFNIADPGREIEDLVVRRAEVFRKKQGIDLLTGHCADTIDTAARLVKGITRDSKPFAFSYDKLLIATGASPIMPNIEGNDLPGVMALKFLDDGRRLKNYLASREVKEVVILGMGYIALEMCEALRARRIEVSMVKPRPGFLPWMDEKLSAVIRQTLEKNGIRMYSGRAVERIRQAGSRLSVCCPDLILEADLVLVSIGVRPNSELAADAGIALGVKKAIRVDRGMRTSDPHVYAAGDCADSFHAVTGEKVWIPLALRANRGGWAVADNVCGKPVELEGIVGTAVFKVFDLQVARTGLTVAEAGQAGFSPAEVIIQARSRAHAHPGSSDIWVHMVGDKKTGKLLGVQMVGQEGVAHRINAAAVALHQKMTVDRFAQTDLAYSPPFSPVWDPMLTAANQLLKNL